MERRNGFVAKRRIVWGSMIFGYGDEFDVCELKIPKHKYMQLLRCGSIAYDHIERTHEQIMKEITDKKLAEQEEKKIVLKHRGGAWFDVIVDNVIVNESALKRKEALEMIDGIKTRDKGEKDG